MESKTFSRETGIIPQLVKSKDLDYSPNWVRANYEITEELLSKLDNAFKECVDKFVNEKRGTKTNDDFLNILRMQGRRYVFAQLLEMHGTWHFTGDSLPNQVKMGKNGGNYLHLTIKEIFK